MKPFILTAMLNSDEIFKPTHLKETFEFFAVMLEDICSSERVPWSFNRWILGWWRVGTAGGCRAADMSKMQHFQIARTCMMRVQLD